MKKNLSKKTASEGQYLSERNAGVLLHITSLPSRFGIGDLGPEARRYADFLRRSNQRYWQLLPLNPTGAEQGYSPYSSVSSIAGNTLLISPELLAEEKLLNVKELPEYHQPITKKVLYKEAAEVRLKLFDIAYVNFLNGKSTKLKSEFSDFVEKESDWLNDFALFMALKEEFGGKPWYQWPASYTLQNEATLQKFSQAHAHKIDKIKWLQFIFFKQWHQLKTYCNKAGIQLFGDMPFYVSYDSADVWSHRDIFSIDTNGKMIGVAGVPPDYFNTNGQRWGMPVFRWDVLKNRRYSWWVHRMKKNIEFFDLLRLDHFRAFAAYWEVPAKEKTAKHGKWKPGPGIELFNVLQTELGTLPFVAEDLGDIDDVVRTLRKNLNLPGMKVLHFAFSENMPESEYIPHNYIANFIAYTGTHDNNTTKGWFRKDLEKEDRERLQRYLGAKVNERNVHVLLSRMAYASVAKTVILPMQDVLGLKENARMNVPAVSANNWLWRMQPDTLKVEEKMLREWTSIYNRAPKRQ